MNMPNGSSSSKSTKKLEDMEQTIKNMQQAIKNIQLTAPEKLQIRFQSVEERSSRLKKIEEYQKHIQEMKTKLPEQIKIKYERFGKDIEKIKKIQDIKGIIQNLREIVPKTITDEFEKMETRLSVIKSEISKAFEKQFRLPALKEMAENMVHRIVSKQFREMTVNYRDKFINRTQDMMNQVIEQLSSISEIGEISDVSESFSKIESGLKDTLGNLEEQLTLMVSEIVGELEKESKKLEEFESLNTDLKQFRDLASKMADQKAAMMGMINQLELETKKLKEERKTKEEEITTLSTEKQDVFRSLDDKDKKIDTLSKEKDEKDQVIGDLTVRQKELLEEYEVLKKELKKFQDMASVDLVNIEETEYNFGQIQNLLKIYMVLMEEIWQSKPHYKILYLLHGDKEIMDRNSIKNATGISGAMVLRAIHEMTSADLINYNEDTGIVSLKRRMFPKK